MTDTPSRVCPRCNRGMPSGAVACPHCKETGIITTSPEPLTPDTGADDTDEIETVEPATPQILPPEGNTARGGSTVGHSFSRSVTRFSATISGGRADADVNIDISQSTVDPDGSLTGDQFRAVMDAWSEAVEREIERGAGTPLSMGEAATRVPLPFLEAGITGLNLAQQEAMTKRAQQAVTAMFRMPGRFPPVPGLEPPEPPIPDDILRQIGTSRPTRRGRGVTITCGGVLALLALAGLALTLAMWPPP